MTELTRHAFKRQAQRSISAPQIDAVIRWGSVYSQNGSEVYFLGKRQHAHAVSEGEPLPLKWVGTAVVVGSDGQIITVIRTSSPSWKDKR